MNIMHLSNITREYISYSLIGTPLEHVARGVRDLFQYPKRSKYPELSEIYAEDKRIDTALRRLIKDSMNCIDIGAHIGSVLNLMTTLSPHGQHIAIEPVPYKNKWLNNKFSNVKIFQVALSDTEGDAQFYVPSCRSGFSGLKLRHSDDTHGVLNVKLAKLDDIIPEDIDIGFIKIDVEGAELFALKGGMRILKRCHPTILFECFPKSLSLYDLTPLDVYNFFSSNGYSIFLIKDWLAHGSPVSYDEFTKAMEYPFQAFNYLAIHQKSS